MDLTEYLARAQRALNQGEFDLAEQYYRQVLTHSPENRDALEGLKILRVDKACKQWSPLTRGVKFAFALLLKIAGRYQKAYPILEIIYACNPSKVKTALLFADCAVKTDELEKAHQVYQHILSQHTSNTVALRADAELLIRLERYPEASELYEQLHQMFPKDEPISHRLRDISARAYAKVGIPEKLTARRAAMEKSLREAPGSPEFVNRLNLLLENHRRNPRDVDTAVALAEHYRLGKKFNEANQVLGPILDADPHNEKARLEQARVWRSAGDLDIASNVLRELSESHPDNLTLKDEFLEARITQLIQQSSSNDPALARELAALQSERAKTRILILQTYMADHPDAAKERAELGTLLLQQHRVEEAIPLLQRLLQEPAWAGKGFFLLGQCFMAQKDFSLAATQFEKSLDFFRNKGYAHVPTEDLKEAYYHLGLTREKMGDKAGSREAYGQVYSSDIHFRDVRERYENTFK